ncbi:MAG TPA: tetratricopeptide repeat protein [Gemmatimonadaceae bacterium]|nr:tetratricopeptide repeat protein [Gemmatimonadaceae bacterium]
MGGAVEDRLESWKQIAAYLNRGVRTVRRWETEEGLPVHRHMHRSLGSVYAYKSEIDTWRETRPTHLAPQVSAEAHGDDEVSRAATTIAVLPFANLSVDQENAYFADGLTEEVISDLSKVQRLRVISRTSSMAFRDTTKDLKTIARELGVRYLLQGSVRRAGDQLRISAQLVDAIRDEHRWAESFDGTLEDVFSIQERLARVIVEALEVQLTQDEQRRLAERPIRDVHAYECYLRARHEAWRWRPDAIAHAIQLLRNGLAIVGDNARLYAALGHAHLQYREAGVDFSEGPFDEAERCAQMVFALEPGSSSGFRLRGWIEYARGRIQDAVRSLKAALELDPNDPDTLLLLSNCYLISGKVPAARPLISRLQKLDPLTPVTRCLPGFADASDGDFEAAVEPYRQMFEMDRGNPMARLFYVWILASSGHHDALVRVLDGFSLAERETVPGRTAQFLAYAVLGREQGVSELVTAEVEAVAATSDVFARFLAEGYAMAGAADDAIRWLSVAVDRGYINHPFLARHDPCLEPVRAHPRFQQLLAAVRERWQRFET